MSHAAAIEYLWVIVAAAGFLINTMALRLAIRSHRRLGRIPGVSEGEMILALSHIRQEALRLGKQCLICLAGVSAVTLAPPPPHLLAVPQTAISASTFVLVSLLMVITSLNDQYARKAAIDSHHRSSERRGGVRRKDDLPRVSDASQVHHDHEETP